MAEPGRKRHIRAGGDSDTKHLVLAPGLPHIFPICLLSRSYVSELKEPRVSGPTPIQRLYLLEPMFLARVLRPLLSPPDLFLHRLL